MVYIPEPAAVDSSESEKEEDVTQPIVFPDCRYKPTHNAWAVHTPSTPSYLQCDAAGMCLRGTCTTKRCVAFGQQVVCNLPMPPPGKNSVAVYTLPLVRTCKNSPVARCPLCRRSITPENAGFNNCFFRVVGVLAGGYGGVYEGKWQEAGDCYVTWWPTPSYLYLTGFDASTSALMEWRVLQFAVRENPAAARPRVQPPGV